MPARTDYSPACPADLEPKAVFPLLADPATYVACKWDLTANATRRGYWLDLFRSHFPKLLAEAERAADADGQNGPRARSARDGARASFFAYLDHLQREPDAFGRLTILEVCYQRERALRQHGIDDPYRVAKQVENEQAMSVLPNLLQELDAMSDPQPR